MASRLVETVMINVDDFADSFLTCGTCFTGYDTRERAAKLLPCSHTVCRSCLDRILETQMQSDSFRCPICRETIAVPAGGARSFPPAFIVNQLLDLIATQRRDIVPKCRLHPNQELLFCETCDVVFCTECRDRTHGSAISNGSCTSLTVCDSQQHQPLEDSTNVPSSSSALNHNVITFNVAIKRCTEIMLYKMHLCVQELDHAQDAVSAELERLTINKNACMEAINSKFAELIALVDRRQAELLDMVKRLADDKHRALTDQLTLIESEREAVRRECNSIKGVMDVRCISKTISYLNDKLDSVTSLTEPRENAFLRYQDGAPDFRAHRHIRHIKTALRSTPQPPTADQMLLGTSHSNQVNALGTDSRPSPVTCISPRSDSSFPCTDSSLIDIARCLAAFGRILVSTTYPALCTIRLPSQLIVHLTAKSTIRAVDYHGRPQCTGGADPVEVLLTDSDGRSVPVELFDMGDGTYDLLLRPITAGLHQLSVRILSRPIRGSPFQLLVRRAQQREWCFSEGADGRGLIQPFAVAYGPYPQSESVTDPTPNSFIYLLDTGNSRLLVINPTTGCLHATLYGTPLTGQAATGIAWAPEGLWIVNWRAKQVYLLDPRTDQTIRSIHSSQFVEPTSACRCPLTGRLYVADNGAGCVFWCDPVTGTTQPFVGAGVRREAECTPPTSPITRTPSPCLSVQENDSHPLIKLPRSESRSFRRVTGICATDNGELILSTGSTVRIFSRDGAQLTTLTPPVFSRENVPCGGTRITTTLPSRATSSAAAYLNRSSASSTLTLNTNCAVRPAVSPTADRHSLCAPGSAQHSAAFPTRGQFGGVVVARLSDDALEWFDSLGVCLLASYSDRQRSGVVVWPQLTWSGCTAQSSVAEGGSDLLCDQPFEDNCLPYLIEADPGLRRLAGLIALSDCRHLVVVDQGAQSLCRLRYA